METKRCPRCKNDLPIQDYYKNTGRRDGLSVYCARCGVAAGRESYLKLRHAAIQHLGGKCRACGYSQDERALQIDHVNGDGRAQRKELSNRQILRAALADAGRCFQLLCANCNQIKRFDEEEHGDRVYDRVIPTERIDRPNERWTPVSPWKTETGERLRVSIGSREREQYRNTMVRLSREIRAYCVKRGMHYALYTTDQNFHQFFLKAVADLGLAR